MYVEADGVPCSGQAINSHTVQRSDALKAIAEGGHVYELGIVNAHSTQRPKIDFRDIGLRKASIFPGFCKRHDNEIFAEIESGMVLNSKRQAALLGYRAVCLEVFKKKINVQLFTDKEVRKAAQHNGRLREIDAFLLGTQLGLADLSRAKKVYEQAIHTRKFDEFHAVIILLDEELPFCFASPFAPEFDYNGNHLLPQIVDEWDSAVAFAGMISGQSLFLVCGFQRPGQHGVESFVASALDIPAPFAGGAAFHTALEYAENTFFRKSWVDSLPIAEREKIKSQFGSGVPGAENQNKARILSLNDPVHVGSTSRVRLCH